MLTFVNELITAPKSRFEYLAASVISICFCCKSASSLDILLNSSEPTSNCANWSRSCFICCLKGIKDLVKFSTFFWDCCVSMSITLVFTVLIIVLLFKNINKKESLNQDSPSSHLPHRVHSRSFLFPHVLNGYLNLYVRHALLHPKQQNTTIRSML